jgi:hypothetical protein
MPPKKANIVATKMEGKAAKATNKATDNNSSSGKTATIEHCKS